MTFEGKVDLASNWSGHSYCILEICNNTKAHATHLSEHTFSIKLQCQTEECAVPLAVYRRLVKVTYDKLLRNRDKELSYM